MVQWMEIHVISSHYWIGDVDDKAFSRVQKIDDRIPMGPQTDDDWMTAQRNQGRSHDQSTPPLGSIASAAHQTLMQNNLWHPVHND